VLHAVDESWGESLEKTCRFPDPFSLCNYYSIREWKTGRLPGQSSISLGTYCLERPTQPGGRNLDSPRKAPGKCEAIALAQTGEGGQQSRQEALDANSVRAPLGAWYVCSDKTTGKATYKLNSLKEQTIKNAGVAKLRGICVLALMLFRQQRILLPPSDTPGVLNLRTPDWETNWHAPRLCSTGTYPN
jgi:hypothetical protein